jgi:hypothetical protein
MLLTTPPMMVYYRASALVGPLDQYINRPSD